MESLCHPKCDAAHYCDRFLGYLCAPCSMYCYTGYPYPNECMIHCPDVYRQMYEASSTAVMTERAVTTVTVTPSEGLDNLFIGAIVLSVLNVLIGIIIYWCRRRRYRRHRGKESSSKTDPENQNASSCSYRFTQSPDQLQYSPNLDQSHSNQAETTLGGADMLLASTVASSSHEDMRSSLVNNGAEFHSVHVYRVAAGLTSAAGLTCAAGLTSAAGLTGAAWLTSAAGLTGDPATMDTLSPNLHLASEPASVASTNSVSMAFNFRSDPMESGIVSNEFPSAPSASNGSGKCQRWR